MRGICWIGLVFIDHGIFGGMASLQETCTNASCTPSRIGVCSSTSGCTFKAWAFLLMTFLPSWMMSENSIPNTTASGTSWQLELVMCMSSYDMARALERPVDQRGIPQIYSRHIYEHFDPTTLVQTFSELLDSFVCWALRLAASSPLHDNIDLIFTNTLFRQRRLQTQPLHEIQHRVAGFVGVRDVVLHTPSS